MDMTAKKKTCEICIHGHFYQPPRDDPFTGEIPTDREAGPYKDWNERINAECYAPVAEAGHFEEISFNLGSTLACWMDQYDHETYSKIVDAEQAYREAHEVSNSLAQPVHHTILPLARTRDKICQIRWGIASFEHRFGHRPEGMWLPEMAVDYDTLQVLVAEGIRFTILSEEQVHGDLKAGAGPYRVEVPNGGEIAVFVRDQALSNAISFEMPEAANAQKWLKDQVAQRKDKLSAKDDPPLLLIATDGETFGHHQEQGVSFLANVLASGADLGCTLTTLGRYLRDHPPQENVEIIPNSAWSCSHGLSRWSIGCDCTPGDSRWKGALRRALDNLACDLDGVYIQEADRMGVNPWALRDDYVSVVLGRTDGSAFLIDQGLGHLSSHKALRLLTLLESQYHRQRMYTSCAFFFEDLDRLEPRYAIANGIRALALTCYATRNDLSHGFRRDLQVAFSGKNGRTGTDILDEILDRAAAARRRSE